MLNPLPAILLRSEVETGRLLAGSGALSVLFGLLLVCLPRRSDLQEIIEVDGQGIEIGAA